MLARYDKTAAFVVNTKENKMSKVTTILFAIVAFWTTGAIAQEMTNTWPQWRGPNRDGTLVGTKLPDSLQELKQFWKVELGPSYSGPIVTGDRVFVTETKDQKVEIVRALDRQTGKELWLRQWDGAISVPFFAKSNGDWIRATAAFDGARLYVAGIRDVLVCLDAQSGEEAWRLDFVKEFKSAVPSFGFVCSPLVVGDHVYVQAGGGFCKIDKQSGKVVWRVLDDGGGMNGSAFSSPYYAKLRGEPQLLVQTRTTLAGVHPDDGKILWSQEVPALQGMNILTPTVYSDAIFTSSYGGRTFLFAPNKAGETWTVNQTWTNKTQGYMSSPLIIGDDLYLHLKNQRFTCIDLRTGEARWTTTPFGKYWSTVTDGEKILALDQNGELLLIRANPDKFDLIDRRQVADDSWAHIAVADRDVVIRALHHVALYSWESR
jgi:outer membrane protein assembly factor BamB